MLNDRSAGERVLTALHVDSGKIKPRSKVRRAYCKLPPSHICTQVIFGTGDFLKGITLTANEGFVRAAAGQVS